MSPSHRRPARWRPALAALLAASAWLVATPAAAQPVAPEVPASAPAGNSALDGQLLYQLLVGEIALTSGNAGTAYEWILDAARRTRDETLFRRAVDIALQARAGEQALAATRAWRLAQPESLDALRLQLQILLLLNRNDGIAEPLQALLALTPQADRAGLIAALPSFLQRTNDPRLLAGVLETALEPYRGADATGVAARVALGRVWLEAREPDRAWALAREAQALDPAARQDILAAINFLNNQSAHGGGEAEATTAAADGSIPGQDALFVAASLAPGAVTNEAMPPRAAESFRWQASPLAAHPTVAAFRPPGDDIRDEPGSGRDAPWSDTPAASDLDLLLLEPVLSELAEDVFREWNRP